MCVCVGGGGEGGILLSVNSTHNIHNPFNPFTPRVSNGDIKVALTFKSVEEIL